MKRVIKMIFALWPFYIIAMVVIFVFAALLGKPSYSPKPQQQTKSSPVPAVLSPPEALIKFTAAIKADNDFEANRVFKLIPAGTPENKAALQLYAGQKKEKAREEKESAQISNQHAISERKAFAKNYERQLLDQGVDVYATVQGKENTTLRIKWILVSRPVVHKMINDGDLVSNLRNMGFTRLVMTDGYDSTWDVNLRPGI